jgi:hypothetical protein
MRLQAAIRLALSATIASAVSMSDRTRASEMLYTMHRPARWLVAYPHHFRQARCSPDVSGALRDRGR